MSSAEVPKDEKSMKSLLKPCVGTQNSQEEKNCKNVCFADTKGKQLVDVRKFVPSSEKLYRMDSIDDFRPLNLSKTNEEKTDGKWITYFHDANADSPEYIQEVHRTNVKLECLKIVDSLENGFQYAHGHVRVHNLHFEKSVFLRITYNNWVSFFEFVCRFERHCSDNNTDLFCFEFPLKAQSSTANSTLEFAIAYHVNNLTYWDNNKDSNYRIYPI